LVTGFTAETQRSQSKAWEIMVQDDPLTRQIIGAAIRVHRHFGPGLLESVYETALEFELSDEGLDVERQKSIPVVYRGVGLDAGLRVDLMVERKVVLELKCVESLLPIHEAVVVHFQWGGLPARRLGAARSQEPFSPSG
jgi:GxxExxY protein